MKQFIVLMLLLCSELVYGKGDSVMVRNLYCSKADSMVLFVEGNNVIQVYGAGVSAAELKLKSLDRALRIGDIKQQGDTLTALAMPYTTAKRLRLAVVNKKTNKLYKEVSFVAATIPEPKAKIGTLKDSVVTKKELLNQDNVHLVFPNSLYSYPYRIQRYTFKAQYKDKNISIPVQGLFIPIEVKKAIKELPANTVVSFTDITAMCPDCAGRQLRDIKILVR
ncbi:MAG: hypothetical protein JSS96_01610 [Bacteroidetes bacterium]|nr:hypothetical protein [Bacteroidota bacterium]